ncbi:hypothetical protein QQX98_003406 [Neonectria punicea]|uniref:Heterokaryon incompatibility domain-containing protein n=1 Tax=Neonectria punicea TaxID=979145 RepID=A0ABR1HEG6_9HYPO
MDPLQSRPMDSYEDDWETESSSSFDSLDLATEVQNLRLDTSPLNPIPLSVSRPDNALCETCKGLELAPRRFVVLPGDKEYGKANEPEQDGIAIGTVEEVAKKKSCPLCRLTLEALGGDRVPTSEDGEAVVIELGWSTDGPRPDPNAPWNHVPAVRVLRPNARKQSGGFIHFEGLNLFPEITLVANDSPVPSATPYFARPILPDKIDFSLIKSWLSACEETHGEGCRVNQVITELGRSHPVDEVPEFRCIDVQAACLVKPPTGCRYAALSYVWGRERFFTTLEENVQDLEEPGAFEKQEYRDEIPQTIKDAIHVTREVGIRYLWADSLCIVQDDVYETKAETIKKMDLVYSAANLVIIAAGSPHAHAGIAGIRPGTREFQQPIEEIGPGFNLAFKTRWQDSMERTVYNTRGWTYQEIHFATRSLVFTGGQVAFRCQAVSEWQEDIFETEAKLDRDGGGPFHGDDIGEFEGLIQTYSGKVLTYNADIYNGFAGVAQQLAYRLETDLCHGTPTAYFDWFLLWGPLADQIRRLSDADDSKQRHPIAPSWSWAGWVGPCFPRIWDWYNRSIRRVKKAIAKRTWIIWYHRENHDSDSVSLIWRHPRLASKAKNLNFYANIADPQ